MIKKMCIRALIGCTLIIILEIFINVFAPTIGNDIAISQLENEDINFYINQTWYNILNYAQAFVALATVIWIWFDTIKELFKMKKENR
jgi:hypothetical protein